MYTYTYTYTLTCSHVRTCMRMCMCVCMYPRTWYKHICVYMYIYIHIVSCAVCTLFTWESYTGLKPSLKFVQRLTGRPCHDRQSPVGPAEAPEKEGSTRPAALPTGTYARTASSLRIRLPLWQYARASTCLSIASKGLVCGNSAVSHHAINCMIVS